jgi:hypothetical protein
VGPIASRKRKFLKFHSLLHPTRVSETACGTKATEEWTNRSLIEMITEGAAELAAPFPKANADFLACPSARHSYRLLLPNSGGCLTAAAAADSIRQP